MDEHWQRELMKLREAPSPAADLWDLVREGPRMPDPGVRDGKRTATVAIAAMVAIAAISLVWIVLRPLGGDERKPGSLGLLDVPPVGQVWPANLDDGRPVFVVHRDDGTVEVIDAFSTHVPYGFAKLVAWCPTSQTFDDIFHGSKWNQDGQYLMGPSPTGLITYETTVEKDGRVQVDSAIPAAPRNAPRTSRPTRPFCSTAANTVFPTLPSPVSGPPAAVAADDPAGWITIRGTLIRRADGGGSELCSFGAGGISTCLDGAPVTVVPTQDPQLSRPLVYSGTFIARVEDGVFINVTAVPKDGMTDSG